MKRSISKIVCVSVMMALSIASLWAVWEGNAGIASAGEFPGTGMYARSDMFPKNTIVEIQNLEKDITVRAVITGSAGIAGLVAVLSPDTAAALNIKAGSVSRVRISIPSPVSEKPAVGTVVSGTGNEITDPDVNPAIAASQANPAGDVSPLSSVAETSANPLVPLQSANTAAVAEPVTGAGAVPVVAPVIASEAAPEPTAETPVSNYAMIDGDEPAEPAVSESRSVATTTDSAPAAADAASTYIPSAIYDEPAVVAVPAETPPEPAVEPDTPSEAVVAAVDSPDAVPEETPGEAVPDSADVALIPAEPIPPQAVETETAADVATVEPIAALPQDAALAEPVPEPLPVAAVSVPLVEAAPVIAETAPKQPAQTAEVTGLTYVSSFTKGSYYIQIASYSDPLNAKKVLDNYGKKYPIVLERSAGKSGDLIKVFIGPVQKDEYGAVLERFKSLGFKDAFVKKGQ